MNCFQPLLKRKKVRSMIFIPNPQRVPWRGPQPITRKGVWRRRPPPASAWPGLPPASCPLPSGLWLMTTESLSHRLVQGSGRIEAAKRSVRGGLSSWEWRRQTWAARDTHFKLEASGFPREPPHLLPRPYWERSKHKRSPDTLCGFQK